MTNIKEYDNDNGNIHREGNLGVYTFGQYYRYTPSDNSEKSAFTEGEIYIVTGLGVHHISQNVHNVTLFIPRHLSNRKDGDSRTMHIAEFERNFTFVEESAAQAERQKLLSNFEEEAKLIEGDIKQALISPQSVMDKIMTETNEAVVKSRDKIDFSIPALPSPEAMSTNSHGIVPTSKGKSIDVLRRQLMNQQHLGEVVTVYAREKKGELQDVMANVFSIKEEEAKAIIGQASNMMDSVGDVESKLEQLTLYMGDNVTVHKIVDGKESSNLSKVTLFSTMIYADEEMLTHDIFSEGDFDHWEFEAFYKRLQDEREFMERILPTERCVVVVRPRRNQRYYSECPFTNQAMNNGNFDSIMLVRDGELVSAIYSTITYQQQMFPTQAEMDNFFSSIKDAEDVRLTDAQRNLKKRHDMYSKVAAILQGIVDRQDAGGDVVFGQLPEHIYSGSFFDPQIVARNIDFINDEDFLIGQHEVLNDVSGWLGKHFTRDHKVNDFIYFNREIISEHSVPSAYHFFAHDRWDPEQRWATTEGNGDSIKKVQLSKGKPAIKVEFECEHYDSKQYGKKKNFYIQLSKRYGFEHLLNISQLKLSDINVVIASRVARPTVSEKMKYLLQARKDITTIMENTKELRTELLALLPRISEDDMHIYILSWASAFNVDVMKAVKPTQAIINKIYGIITSEVILNESMLDNLKSKAQKKDEEAIAVARDKVSTFLITNRSKGILSSTPHWYGDDLNEDNTFLQVGVGIYEIKNGSLKAVDSISKTIPKLRFEHFYKDEDGTNTHPQNIFMKCFNKYPTELSQPDSCIGSPENIKAKDELTKWALKINGALSGSDAEKVSLIEEIMDHCDMEEIYEDKRAKSSEIITPRVRFIAGITIKQPQYDKAQYGERHIPEVAFSYLYINFLSAAATLIRSIEDSTLQKKKLMNFWMYLNSEFYFKEEVAQDFAKRSGEGESILKARTYLGESPFDHHMSEYYRNDSGDIPAGFLSSLNLNELDLPLITNGK
ncbi:hypothetical protein VCHA53O466_50254 [Vibrio chagasii]|nr:hypothetical protein VCHA53O466_50254 [Vibrio chagasii]